MKYLVMISLFLGLAGVLSFNAEGDEALSSVASSVKTGPLEPLVHGQITDVPVQSTTDDEVKFNVVGLLENSCRRTGPTYIYYDVPTRTFAIDQMIQTTGQVCLQRVMPFSVAVNLGRLQPGNYHVQLGREIQRGQGFTVKSSTTELR